MADVIYSVPVEGVRSVPQGLIGNTDGDTADSAEMVDTLAKLNSAIADATLIDTADARLSDARTPSAHTHPASELSDSTAAGRSMITAADAAAQRTLLNVESGATADQSDSEIETAYNSQVGVVSQAAAEAGTSTTAERWTPLRVAQAIAALGTGGDLSTTDIDTLAELNAILTDATLGDTTAAGRTLMAAADAAAQRTALNVEDGSTADQTDSEIETAYNNQVGVMSQAAAEAGTSTTAERITPQRVKQVIDALAPAAVVQLLNTETDGATVTFDMDDSNLHTVELAGNRTLALANVTVGQRFVLRLEQDATGSRTVTWFSGISWFEGGAVPTLTTTGDAVDVFGFICVSSGVYDGFIIGQDG